MKKIFKYEINADAVTGVAMVRLPNQHRLLSVQLQGSKICLWAEVVLETMQVDLPFYVVMTGQEVPPSAGDFLGTVQIPLSAPGLVSIVVHVYGPRY